ncbi:MAG: hypothetical protein L6R39_007504 [Caloplaca ligustica]|nr:MAG: hypothetical protein L6R39_007504 [Caloplaca ligustica]
MNPRDIRNMAGWVVDQCVVGKGQGGAISHGHQKAINAINDPAFDPTEHELPPAATFFALHIWNTGRDKLWLAGDDDPALAVPIDAGIWIASRRAPAGSALRRQLQRKIEYYAERIQTMTYKRRLPWWRDNI